MKEECEIVAGIQTVFIGSLHEAVQDDAGLRTLGRVGKEEILPVMFLRA